MTADNLSDDLYRLSKHLGQLNPNAQAHGLLGGEWGYGQEFKNGVFEMHPYCWCEQDNCPWCEGTAPNFHHLESGLKVSWYKFISRGMEANKAISVKEFRRIIDQCVASANHSKPQQKEEL